MSDQTETEILDGARAWAETQAAFKSAPDTSRPTFRTTCGWYDTIVDENEGAFCVIRSGSDLEDLVGDFVQIEYDGRVVWLYCVGGSSDVPTDLALARAAFLRLENLQVEEITVVARATTK